MLKTLRDALERLTIAELKDLVSNLPGSEKSGRKDELIGRIVDGIRGLGLKSIWLGLDETQQSAIAEAVHHPLGEYSGQRKTVTVTTPIPAPEWRLFYVYSNQRH